MNSSSIVAVIPVSKPGFVKRFFDATQQASPPPKFKTTSLFKSRGEIAQQILALNNLPNKDEIKAVIESIIKSYFAKHANAKNVYHFYSQLLQCDSEYQIEVNLAKRLFSESARIAIEELKTQCYSDWMSLKDDQNIVKDLTSAIVSERQLGKEAVYNVEKTVKKQIKKQLMLINGQLNKKMRSIIRALQQDYEKHKELAESRKTIPNGILKCKLLTYASNLVGSGIGTEIGTRVGDAMETLMSSTKLGVKIRKWSYDKFNARETYNLMHLPELPDYYFQDMHRFIEEHIQDLRKDFLLPFYSKEAIYTIAVQEQANLFADNIKNNIFLTSENFQQELKTRIHNGVNLFTDIYIGTVNKFRQKFALTNAAEDSYSKLSQFFLLGLCMVSPNWMRSKSDGDKDVLIPNWFITSIDPLVDMQDDAKLIEILNGTIAAGDNIVDLVRNFSWFKEIHNPDIERLLGFIRIKKSMIQNKKSEYLGMELDIEKECRSHRARTFLAMYIISVAFVKHCHVFMPEFMTNQQAKFNALCEIMHFGTHPIFRTADGNILFTVLHLAAGQMLQEPELNQRLIDYLTPDLCARLQIPNPVLKTIRGRWVCDDEFYAKKDELQKLYAVNYVRESTQPCLQPLHPTTPYAVNQSFALQQFINNHYTRINLRKRKESKKLQALEEANVPSVTSSETNIYTREEVNERLATLLYEKKSTMPDVVNHVVSLPALVHENLSESMHISGLINKALMENKKRFVLPILLLKHWTVAAINVEKDLHDVIQEIDITFYDTLPLREPRKLLEMSLIHLLPERYHTLVHVKIIETQQQMTLKQDGRIMLENAAALLTSYCILPRKARSFDETHKANQPHLPFLFKKTSPLVFHPDVFKKNDGLPGISRHTRSE